MGFRFAETRVGWLVARRDKGRFKFSWSPPSVAGVLGFHLGVPHGQSALGIRRAVVGAAGPLVTLCIALACRAAAAALGRTTTTGGAIASDLLRVAT